MKHKTDKIDETSAGLNQIIEIINAKGDEGELKEIISNTKIISHEEKDKTLK
ncbi:MULTISPECIES: hypothetical protein [Bacillaceae]|uniref:hypothetical protein n=1 Tax=Bacillaceae TaxID=186817 RepID=UPI0013ED21CB|nr:hypothetical protein [Ectobacillus funiculus]